MRIEWDRVNALPRHVFFNHSIHVAKGVGCVTCHGRVDTMAQVHQVELQGFWDDQTHLDHLDVLKQAIRRAAYFKINAFTLRLNEHFEHASAPALVDPYALSPAEVQGLTDYGREYFVQVVPYLDGPAHVNFILQRDEFAKLREFPDEAFEMCSTNPETYGLLEGMFQDLIDATKGLTCADFPTGGPAPLPSLPDPASCSAAKARCPSAFDDK